MTKEQVEAGSKILEKIERIKKSTECLKTLYSRSIEKKTRIQVDFGVSDGYGNHHYFTSNNNDWFRDQVYKLLLDEANTELTFLENELKKL
jgi:hypothetical protein